MRIEIVLVRPRAFESWTVTLPMGATVAMALEAAGLTPEWLLKRL